MKKFKLVQHRSTIGCTQQQKDTLRCLGLRGRHTTNTVDDNPAMRGQITKVQHLITVEVVR